MTAPISNVSNASNAANAANALRGPTGWFGVLAGGRLRGINVPCFSPLTLILDADLDEQPPRAGVLALRLLAGIGRPSAGTVRVFGVDPGNDPELRRHIALVGDDVLLEPGRDAIDSALEIATIRRLSPLPTRAALAAIVEGLAPSAARRRLSRVIAGAERARLLLLSYPEREVDPRERDEWAKLARSVLARGAHVVVATTKLDDWLGVADDVSAHAFVLRGGVVATGGPAHALPWSVPPDHAPRVVTVVLDPDPKLEPTDQDHDATPPAARLLSDLVKDPDVGPHLAAIEPIGPHEVRLHTRAPRELARAIGRRAAAGLAVRRLSVHGAAASALAVAGAPR